MMSEAVVDNCNQIRVTLWGQCCLRHSGGPWGGDCGPGDWSAGCGSSRFLGAAERATVLSRRGRAGSYRESCRSHIRGTVKVCHSQKCRCSLSRKPFSFRTVVMRCGYWLAQRSVNSIAFPRSFICVVLSVSFSFHYTRCVALYYGSGARNQKLRNF